MPFDVSEATPTMMKVADLRPSPRNRRTRVDAEFVASIVEHGVLERLVVRELYPPPEDGPIHEIVCGHRRWMGASEAKLAEVPVDIRELDDRQAMEIAIVENLHRESLTPLEEADAFRWLIEEQGRSVSDIAARVHKSESYVRQRMHLHGLIAPIKRRLDEDKISMDAALLLAQTPENVQTEVSDDIERQLAAWREPGTLNRIARSDVANWLSEHWRRLYEAPFDISDKTLNEVAGACGSCPKRTGTQGVLFDVVEVADACLDSVCWDTKAKEGWVRKAEDAKKRGLRVLTDAEMKKVVPYGHRVDLGSSWIDVNERTFADQSGEQRWRDVVGEDVPRAIGRVEDTGKVFELVERKAALASAKSLAATSDNEDLADEVKALEKRTTSSEAADKRSAADEKRRREKEKQAAADREAELGRIVDAAVAAFLDGNLEKALRGIVELLTVGTWSDTLARFVAHRKIDADDGRGGKLEREDAIRRWASAANPPDLFGAIWELVQRQADAKGDDREIARAVLKVLPAGVVKRPAKASAAKVPDVAKATAKAKSKAATKAKAAKKPAPKPVAKKAPTKKRRGAR